VTKLTASLKGLSQTNFFRVVIAFGVLMSLILGASGVIVERNNAQRGKESQLNQARILDTAEDVKRLVKNQEQQLDIILEVTGCELDSSPGECAAQTAKRSVEDGQPRILELDCRFRRALEGKPPPPPGTPCITD